MKMKCIFPIPMNNIYIKEKEFSSREKISKDNLSLSMDLKKHKFSLNVEGI